MKIKWIAGLCVLLGGLFLALDLLAPLGIAAGVLQAIVVLVSLSLRRTGLVWAAAMGSSALVAIGYFGSPWHLALPEWAIVTNRLLSLVIIWVVALMGTRMLKSEAQLRLSQEHLRGLLDTAVDGAITIDIRGTVLSFNRAAERIFRFQKEDVIGRNIAKLMPPPYKDEHDRYLQAYFTTGQKKIIGIGREVSGLRKDGTVFPMDLAVSELDLDGERIFLGMVRDVTERKRHEEQLQSYAARLERSNRELESFASVASHDLQEPLRKIASFGERLEAKLAGQTDPVVRDYLGRMTDAARRMQQLIDDLLTFSRVTTKARPFARLDLNALLKEVTGDLEARIEQHKAEVRIEPLPVLEADRLQMRQLFQNLIGNALKFVRDGEPPRVQVRGRTEDGCCVIEVEDNGIGFEEKYLDRIFNLFERLHGRKEYEGTGMGLAICKKIAERHGGTIGARSRPGEGSTFVVRLPLKQAVAREEASHERA